MTSEKERISKLLEMVNVSRETLDKLVIYQNLLEKWNSKINLVGRSTVELAWERHFLDSAQLWSIAPPFQTWVDLGSGAGFPGLVLAIISNELRPDARFHLVESDARKCAFLRSVSRETNVPVTIHNSRIEDVTDLRFDILSARALAPLDKLLIYAEKLLHSNGECLFLKGRECDRELENAAHSWNFSLEKLPSLTGEGSSILRIGDLRSAECG